MLPCEKCRVSLNTLKDYVDHVFLHSHENKFQFPCPFSECSRYYHNYNSFKSHVYRDHNLKDSAETFLNTECSLKCSRCKVSSTDISSLINHLRQHISNESKLECPFLNCNLEFHNKSSFTSHVYRKHKERSSNFSLILKQDNLSDTSVKGNVNDIYQNVLDSVYLSAEDVQNFHQQNTSFSSTLSSAPCTSAQGTPNELYLKNLALFYLKLQVKYFIPSTTIQMLIDEFQGLHSLNISSIMQQLKEKLSSSITDSQLQELISLVQNGDLLTYCNNNFLKTDYLRKKFYKSNFMYVEPIKVYLGRDKYRKHCFAQYVPIKETLQSLLKQEQVYSQFIINQDTEPGIFSDIVDGSVYKKNELFKQASNAIQILLFQDSFEIVNPLGSARKKHKILAVYMTLGNILPHQRLNIDFIQLVLLCKENDMKFFGHERLFSKLISDLKDLENDGLLVNGTLFKGSILCIIGDNLGSHTIGGFAESFIVEHFCRYCNITKSMFIQQPYFTGDLRTPESYNIIVDQKHDAIVNGIKCNSIFNELKYFHVCSPGLPPCLGHDLFEGVVSNDLYLFLEYFVKVKKYFTFQELNSLITSFKYVDTDAADKPSEINVSRKKLGGHASQNWCLLRLFPIIVRNYAINFDDDVYSLYVKLKCIVELVCAPQISWPQVAYLKDLIEEYIQCLTEFFPEYNLKPKHHYMVHYPELIIKFGPLMRVCTLRFESKHGFFKKCARISQNFKNICSMLATRHQMCQAFYHSGKLFNDAVIAENAVAFHPDVYSSQIHEVLQNYSFNPETTEVAYDVKIKGTLYKKGLHMILKDDDKINFGKIMLILIEKNKDVIFVMEVLNTTFLCEVGIYRVSSETEPILSSRKIEEFIDYYPLSSYEIKGESYITLHHSFIDNLQ